MVKMVKTASARIGSCMRRSPVQVGQVMGRVDSRWEGVEG